ncbi:hypothetical protein CEXT_472911 [Caerostris extrusa]|uniref:Uncharacterized protein n=1 Tax=Caerostris extrusa TaxID=172846 RepID=A0AAV4X9C4_CAEEX|nr:hypothetical protein CEXT_472911 [Caerostris extrusa]
MCECARNAQLGEERLSADYNGINSGAPLPTSREYAPAAMKAAIRHASLESELQDALFARVQEGRWLSPWLLSVCSRKRVIDAFLTWFVSKQHAKQRLLMDAQHANPPLIGPKKFWSHCPHFQKKQLLKPPH